MSDSCSRLRMTLIVLNRYWTHDLVAPGMPSVNEDYARSNSRTLHART